MNILVTGGASGLGAAITREFAASPEHKVFFTYCRSEEKARALAAEFPNTKGIRCDFTKPDDIATLVVAMEEMELEALVNNAVTGITLKRFHEAPPDDFLDGFKRNVLPVVTITQKAITIFRERGEGRIVTVLTSYLSGVPPLGLSAYVAEKAYLASASRSWAAENARFNIAANTISPAFMATDLTRGMDPRLVLGLAKHALPPERVAVAVAELLSRPFRVTGIDVPVS